MFHMEDIDEEDRGASGQQSQQQQAPSIVRRGPTPTPTPPETSHRPSFAMHHRDSITGPSSSASSSGKVVPAPPTLRMNSSSTRIPTSESMLPTPPLTPQP